jgi:protein-S-isoprenylcysteine O-methyltransferase Ste14
MRWLQGRRLPRTTGAILHVIALPTAHAVVPWALSLLGSRHGWTEGGPGIWNLLGLILVMIGFYVLFLCIRFHFRAAPEGWLLETTPHYPTPAYLLTEGPYRYSRNPIYLAELAIWLGWMAFYGSWVVLGAFVALALLVGPFVVRREEGGLQARFGEAFIAYQHNTPRWLGRGRSSTSTDR